MKKKKVCGTTASYGTKEGAVCDVDKLAEEYSNYWNVPKYIDDARAMEIQILARAYRRYKSLYDKLSRKKRGSNV